MGAIKDASVSSAKSIGGIGSGLLKSIFTKEVKGEDGKVTRNFSLGRTLLSAFGIVAATAAIKNREKIVDLAEDAFGKNKDRSLGSGFGAKLNGVADSADGALDSTNEMAGDTFDRVKDLMPDINSKQALMVGGGLAGLLLVMGVGKVTGTGFGGGLGITAASTVLGYLGYKGLSKDLDNPMSMDAFENSALEM